MAPLFTWFGSLFDKNTKKEFLEPLDNINYINNLEQLGIKRNQLNNLTHCWFEGVNPWL